jgi:hypothetical protein
MDDAMREVARQVDHSDGQVMVYYAVPADPLDVLGVILAGVMTVSIVWQWLRSR